MTTDTSPASRDSWPAVRSALRRIADDAGLISTASRLGGVNVMTPDVVGTYKTGAGRRTVEVATGRSINSEWMIGVSVRPDPDNRLSRLCFTYEQVVEALAEVTK